VGYAILKIVTDNVVFDGPAGTVFDDDALQHSVRYTRTKSVFAIRWSILYPGSSSKELRPLSLMCAEVQTRIRQGSPGLVIKSRLVWTNIVKANCLVRVPIRRSKVVLGLEGLSETGQFSLPAGA
jgi:hypothetical protein